MENDNFEEKLKKIDEILNELNGKDINLQDSVNIYKKGIKLLKESRKILEDIKLEVEYINKDEE
ncbi:30S ribosomal protein S17 [Campylobacter sputorum subsp. bubulus]|uniref:Exodeoxyribonuclease VII small subunit n=1 Tax=Campylobacter sputorum subsp. sputorum TaxID=32024 RepID=A0A381DKS8_9BACT|nr:exodeoxyribonuclease VII small subunit [Campylobacter sputorum]ASM34635.1 exodeoxyribonuclease VII, small subunit [Campylobacter sputorum aubsp. sputorum RM3237]KAB0581150.1 exodeoxyribonuclease VII small subunit [Campylobacter sputorum subsp. sputorum]QEL04826.1 exodeoxyribonuclease VII, small subunit [Campylobacter sputorum subsp. sputorum]SUX09821.1 30S ribosomal protein S17 [Campylobacter sputorum subsp. bubulus]SUX11312.1 30S ribosomal protein S17 [Campylobacter sputorum subsp. sputoru